MMNVKAECVQYDDYICIGGPLNGETKRLARHLRDWRIPKYIQVDSIYSSYHIPYSALYEQEVYKVNILSIKKPSGQYTFKALVHESFTDKEALDFYMENLSGSELLKEKPGY